MSLKAQNLLLNIHAQSHFDNQSLRRLKYNFCEMGFLSFGQLLQKEFVDKTVSQQSPSSCFCILWLHKSLPVTS